MLATSGEIATASTFEAVAPNTLYERLGGEEAMDAVVKRFYEKVLADERINGMFKNTNMVRQHKMQKAFLSHAFGGPAYNGKNMRQAHKRLGITDFHFNAVGEHVLSTLQEFNVGKEMQKEVMDIVESTRGDVLGKDGETTKTITTTTTTSLSKHHLLGLLLVTMIALIAIMVL